MRQGNTILENTNELPIEIIDSVFASDVYNGFRETCKRNAIAANYLPSKEEVDKLKEIGILLTISQDEAVKKMFFEYMWRRANTL